MIKKVKCWGCEKEIEIQVEEYYNPHNLKVYDKEWNNRKNLNKREYCKECQQKHSATIKKHREEYSKLSARLMIERAIKIIERQNIDVYEYREAIDVVEESFIENLERFRSAEEIVATIILIQHEIGVKNNFKIGKYIADIYIQSLTCIIEIDGYMHDRENIKEKDGSKDIYIRSLLGNQWEVIRIPTKYINENVENLVSAIIELKSNMMKLREDNGGLLPYGYSRTLNKSYDKILKTKKG
jgi:very-short-patch-repair endonuclease